MHIVLTSIITAVLLAAGASLVFYEAQKPVYQVGAMPTVRIGDPGHNLIGRDWSALPRPAQSTTRVSRWNGDREQ